VTKKSIKDNEKKSNENSDDMQRDWQRMRIHSNKKKSELAQRRKKETSTGT